MCILFLTATGDVNITCGKHLPYTRTNTNLTSPFVTDSTKTDMTTAYTETITATQTLHESRTGRTEQNDQPTSVTPTNDVTDKATTLEVSIESTATRPNSLTMDVTKMSLTTGIIHK